MTSDSSLHHPHYAPIVPRRSKIVAIHRLIPKKDSPKKKPYATGGRKTSSLTKRRKQNAVKKRRANEREKLGSQGTWERRARKKWARREGAKERQRERGSFLIFMPSASGRFRRGSRYTSALNDDARASIGPLTSKKRPRRDFQKVPLPLPP